MDIAGSVSGRSVACANGAAQQAIKFMLDRGALARRLLERFEIRDSHVTARIMDHFRLS